MQRFSMKNKYEQIDSGSNRSSSAEITGACQGVMYFQKPLPNDCLRV